MVVDTSALLAVFFNEDHGSVIARILQDHSSELRMSTVNLSETLIDVFQMNCDPLRWSPEK